MATCPVCSVSTRDAQPQVSQQPLRQDAFRLSCVPAYWTTPRILDGFVVDFTLAMKNSPYLRDICLALIVNVLIFFTISISDVRAKFGFDCIGGCQDWLAYASTRIFSTSGSFVYALFFTPLLAVAIAFRGKTIRKVFLAVFLAVLMYNLSHLFSIWNKSFDIHGDEAGLFVLMASIGIGVLSIPVSVISTAISLFLERRKVG